MGHAFFSVGLFPIQSPLNCPNQASLEIRWWNIAANWEQDPKNHIAWQGKIICACVCFYLLYKKNHVTHKSSKILCNGSLNHKHWYVLSNQRPGGDEFLTGSDSLATDDELKMLLDFKRTQHSPGFDSLGSNLSQSRSQTSSEGLNLITRFCSTAAVAVVKLNSRAKANVPGFGGF